MLFFFFRHTLQANNTSPAALRDFLAQVLEYSPPLQRDLIKRLKEGGVEQLALADLYQLLRTALQDMRKVYLVADALDELEQDNLEPFVTLIDELGQCRPLEIKLIVTSRPLAVVDKLVRGIKVLDVRLDKQFIESDISKYIWHRIRDSSIPLEHHSTVHDTVLCQADGIFLYARLSLDILSSGSTDTLTALQSLPTDLAVIYESLLEEHAWRSTISASLQQVILECVIYATRPLRLLELADLLQVTRKDTHDLGEIQDMIRLACGPLLEILPDETICVVHHSLTEYLEGSSRLDRAGKYPVLEFGATHNKLGLLCITYLKSGCLDCVEIPEQNPFTGMLYRQSPSEFTPFTQYAATNWHIHVRNAELAGVDQSKTNRELHELLVGNNLEKLAHLANVKANDSTSALGLSTLFQLESYVKDLLEPSDHMMRVDQTSMDLAIRESAQRGHAPIVKLLIEHGANPVAYDIKGMTALHLAVFKRHHDVVSILLDSGVDPFVDAGPNKSFDHSSMGGTTKRPPIMLAIVSGDISLVSTFWPYIKTPEAAVNAFHWAVDSHNDSVIRKILSHPLLDVNAPLHGQTALYKTCAKRQADTIELLLKAGADPNILEHQERGEKETGYNALHSLAGWVYPMGVTVGSVGQDQSVRCFKLLLEAGAKVDQVDIKQQTPLHVATDVVAVQCLLEGGANPNAINAFGETVLHISKEDAVIRLLASKADIDTRTAWRGYTPLLSVLADKFAHNEHQVKRAYLLVELGADVTIVDNDGDSALHHAVGIHDVARIGHSLIEQIIARGGDVNQRNKQGQTPVHKMGAGAEGAGFRSYSAKSLDPKLLKILVAAGADLEARDDRGQTPLFQMLSCWTTRRDEEGIELCKLMTECGARLDTVDLQGRTLLHGVVRNCNDDASLLKFLVARGLDPHQTDYDGNTLWHVAAPHFAKEKARLQFFAELRGLGISPAVSNAFGRTPLHVISSFEPSAFDPGTSFSMDGRKTNVDDATAFDYFLASHDDVDYSDKDGVTPLHLASTFSEYQTRRLLDAGADPTRATENGLTPFHLAARSRQSNVLGILIRRLESSFRQEHALTVLNKQDQLGRSPLFYACASGTFENVQLLLQAGAIVDVDTYVGSAWEGCVEFEKELTQATWLRPADNSSTDRWGIECGSVLITDPTRPRVIRTPQYPPYPYPIERLDEILELLVASGSESGRRFIDKAIISAVEEHRDYTVECLLRVRDTMELEHLFETEHDILTCLQRRKDTQASPPKPGDTKVDHLMALRSYSSAREAILSDEGIFERQHSQSMGMTLLHNLALGGFATLMDQIATPEIFQKLERRLDEGGSEGGHSFTATACRREMPNMDVLQMLVEKKSVNIDAMVPSNQFSQIGLETALHCLVRGGHWWQVEQALPYLLSKGANTELSDGLGLTPLNVALQNIKGPNFNKRIIEILLKYGANPNAVDNRDVSCLSRASSNREIYQLLIQHGAIVTQSALAAAIKACDVDLLQTMLESGVDPNIRQVGKEVPSWVSPGRTSFRDARRDPHTLSEYYPIDYVLFEYANDWRKKDASERMLNLLLEYGADPAARYQKTTVLFRTLRIGRLNGKLDGGRNQFLMTLLRHPKTDLEDREYDGVTPLLVACSLGVMNGNGPGDERSLVQTLVGLGANIRARNDLGDTALHYLVEIQPLDDPKRTATRFLDMKYVLETAPDLLHSLNKRGQQPLHCAFYPTVHGEAIELLLSSGADVCRQVVSTGQNSLHLLFGSHWQIDIDDKIESATQDFSHGVTTWHGDLLTRFLAMGADVNTRDKNGETPIFTFFRAGSVSAKVTYPGPPRGNGDQIHHERVRRQRYEQDLAIEKEHLLWELFDRIGVDWNVTNRKGETLLHRVVQVDAASESSFPGRRLKRYRFLVEKGLDPLQKDFDHRTVLDIAAAVNAEDILELFRRM